MSAAPSAQATSVVHKALRAQVRARRVAARLAKGDFPGHPFRGNQYASGEGHAPGIMSINPNDAFDDIFGGSGGGGGGEYKRPADRPWKDLSQSEQQTRASDYVNHWDNKLRQAKDSYSRTQAETKMEHIKNLMADPSGRKLMEATSSWHENRRIEQVRQAEQRVLQQRIASGMGPDDLYNTPPDKLRQRVLATAETVGRAARAADAVLGIASDFTGVNQSSAPSHPLAVAAVSAAALVSLAANLGVLSRSKNPTTGAMALRGALKSSQTLASELPRLRAAAAATDGAARARVNALVSSVTSTLGQAASSPRGIAMQQAAARTAFRATGGTIVPARPRPLTMQLAPGRIVKRAQGALRRNKKAIEAM